jgi:phage gp45-like
MSGSPKEKLGTQTVEETVEESEREIYLRDGRKLVLSEQNSEQLVEVRNESGMLEVRIRLTAEGPVLQMESARLQLKATEQVSIESARVEIKGTEHVAVSGGKVAVSAEEDVNVDAKGEVRVVGKMIYLN